MIHTTRVIYQALCICGQETICQMEVLTGDRRNNVIIGKRQIANMVDSTVIVLVSHVQLCVVAHARTDIRVGWMDPIQHRIICTKEFSNNQNNPTEGLEFIQYWSTQTISTSN